MALAQPGYVYQQPDGDRQRLAVQAMISCPTGSIRTHQPQRNARETLSASSIGWVVLGVESCFWIGLLGAFRIF